MPTDLSAAPISTIIFDLSEVLITGLLDIEKPLAHRLGIPSDGLFPAFGGQPLTELFCGRITEDAYLDALIEKQRWNISKDELKVLIRQNFHRRIPGMEQVVANLSARFELVLLSDHAREWIADIKTYHPFLELCTHQFYSYELGQTKAAPSTFTRVLDTIQRCPGQCLFIDDWIDNVAAAQRAEIRAIRFLGAADLMRRLTEMGLWK